MMEMEPKDLSVAFEQTNLPNVEEKLKTLKKARDEALAAHKLDRQKMAERGKYKYTPFQVGDLVWLKGKNLKIRYPSKKIAPKREGLFPIIKALRPVTFKLKLPDQWRIHPVFHASLLTAFKETDEHGLNFTNPSPDLIDGEEQYEVEAILAHRRRGRGYQYLIKWVGYSSSENMWRSTEDLKGSLELLQTYKQ